MSTPTLFSETTVHCFWYPKCQTVVHDIDAQAAHDRMEEHYRLEHDIDIDAIVRPGKHRNFDAKHAARYAAKFAADTLLGEPSRPLAPTDANLVRVLSECSRRPRRDELAMIRDVYVEVYGVSA